MGKPTIGGAIVHRILPRVFLAFTLALTTIALPPWFGTSPVAAAFPTPGAPMTVRFEAGGHTGYRFDAAGAILGRRSATLSRASSAHTTERAMIPGHGVHLRISDGIWAGYWIRESIVAHVAGVVGPSTYPAPRRLSFPAGRVIGYRFDAAWQLTSAKVIGLTRSSSADASMSAAINGIVYHRVINGGLAETWVPAASSTAVRGLACQTGARATGAAAVYTRLGGATGEVGLTFDLGGRTDPAMVIAKRLLLYGVCTTVFPTGDAALTMAGNAVLEFMDDYPAVFEFGNHTKDHCDLVNGGGDTGCPTARPSASFVGSQLTSAGSIIGSVTGQSPIPYWRPPYGAHDAAVRSAAAAVGYPKTVMWDVDTIDWRPPPPTDNGPTTVQIIDKVVAKTVSGSIVLMHLGGWNTYAALPSMVNGLRGRGLVPTSVSDLAGGS
jgi:peptidoglycan/xylan/chitin deacetylase (PgdA/CDA1 family)